MKLLHITLPSVEIVRFHIVTDIVQVLNRQTGKLTNKYVELLTIILDEGGSHTPSQAEEIWSLELAGIHGRVVFRCSQYAIKQLAQLIDQVKVGPRRDMPEWLDKFVTGNTFVDTIHNRWNIFLE